MSTNLLDEHLAAACNTNVLGDTAAAAAITQMRCVYVTNAA